MMNDICKDLIYLLACAVNAITPDTERCKAMDLEKLYKLAQRHSVSSAVCIALEHAGIQDKQFHEAYKKAVRKNIMFDIERAAIFEEFEKNEIWYIPLKGAILKELYPENGMREMADNDVLIDPNNTEKVRDIMVKKGYTVKNYGISKDDIYIKMPFLNFEMHNSLFEELTSDLLQEYYSDIQKKLFKDENNNYGFHFSDEDFYIYLIAHEWKHFKRAGTGIRSLLDCYVYLRALNDTLNFRYIAEQMEILELSEFEHAQRELSFKLFSSTNIPQLSSTEADMLMIYITSGTYGTYDRLYVQELKGKSKLDYILHQMFPNLTMMKKSVKFVNKCKYLYPIGIVYRWGRILLKRREHLAALIKAMKKVDHKE